MPKFDWDGTIDKIQFGMLWFIIGVIVICVSVLILFDVLAGTGIMIYLTNGNTLASIIISLSTSGLLVALMFISYNAGEKNKFSVGFIVGSLAFIVYCLDVYFDSLTADYLRFNSIIVLKEIPNSSVHVLFRILIGGISTVGESLAMAIIFGLPVLKGMINRAIPQSMKGSSPAGYPQPNNRPNNNPQHRQTSSPSPAMQHIKNNPMAMPGMGGQSKPQIKTRPDLPPFLMEDDDEE